MSAEHQSQGHNHQESGSPQGFDIVEAAYSDVHLFALMLMNDGIQTVSYARLERDFADVAQGKRKIWFAYPDFQNGLLYKIPVGMVQLRFHNEELPWMTSNKQAELHNFRVTKEYQGQGVGSKLYATLEAEARQRSYQYISLRVLRDNAPAIAIYGHWGFVPWYDRNRESIEMTMQKKL